jgi:diguanylate cyclase (GGDEF)-like protein
VNRSGIEQLTNLPLPAFVEVEGVLAYANNAAHALGMRWPRDRHRPVSDFLALVEPGCHDTRQADDGTRNQLVQVRAQSEEERRILELRSSPTEVDGVTGTLICCWDVTERVRRENELRYHAEHDSLTGLLRRWAFLSRTSQALRTADGNNLVALLVADMNDFKGVNDSYGHLIGDEVLTEIANRLRATVRSGDAVARFGGDEFLILALGLQSDAEAKRLVERIHRSLAEPVLVSNGAVVRVSLTVGLAVQDRPVRDDDGLVTSRLLEVADRNVMQRKQRNNDRPGHRIEPRR